MRYRVAYASAADEALKKLPDPSGFRAAVERTIGSDPYGRGTSAAGGDSDRREATVEGVILRYTVSQASSQ